MDSSKARILVVDDSVDNLQLLTSILTRRDYAVRPATSGQAALQTAKVELPDLILLDILMPFMDGYEVCERLKADERTRDIPVIFVSALGEVFDKVRAFSVGGVDYIPKPFHLREVLARVETHLALRRLQQELQERNAQITALNERLDRLLRQFASKEVADELLSQGFSLGGKHVEATAMFADIREFTTITESQPPDLTIELLNDYYAYMIEAVSSEGGIVNQLFGDGIMCIFGAPVSQQDHPHRAVRAALRMIERLALFNQEQATKGKVQIRIGVGIATGEGVAGYIGTQMRTNYTWVSDATNLAYRLEDHTKQVGKPILIDENTRLALDDSVQVEDEGMVSLRGKAQAVRIFSVPVEQPRPGTPG
jgi:adenylate cyclase